MNSKSSQGKWRHQWVVLYWMLYDNNLWRCPQQDRDSEELCGLSLYLPESDRSISRYSFLALYREVDLVGLYRRMLAGGAVGKV